MSLLPVTNDWVKLRNCEWKREPGNDDYNEKPFIPNAGIYMHLWRYYIITCNCKIGQQLKWWIIIDKSMEIILKSLSFLASDFWFYVRARNTTMHSEMKYLIFLCYWNMFFSWISLHLVIITIIILRHCNMTFCW